MLTASDFFPAPAGTTDASGHPRRRLSIQVMRALRKNGKPVVHCL